MSCEHPDFVAAVTVNRLEDSGKFVADIRIRCSVCQLDFCFDGLPRGSNVDEPMAGAFGIEARLPIHPISADKKPEPMRFTIPEVPK